MKRLYVKPLTEEFSCAPSSFYAASKTDPNTKWETEKDNEKENVNDEDEPNPNSGSGANSFNLWDY